MFCLALMGNYLVSPQHILRNPKSTNAFTPENTDRNPNFKDDRIKEEQARLKKEHEKMLLPMIKTHKTSTQKSAAFLLEAKFQPLVAPTPLYSIVEPRKRKILIPANSLQLHI